MGEGMLDWPWFAGAITKAGFAGPISVHVEYPIAGATPDEIRRNMMAAARHDLEFARRQFAAVHNVGAGL
jgi:sugar phosphate isomerase/epimerase